MTIINRRSNLPYIFLTCLLVVSSLLLVNNSFSKAIFLAVLFFVFGIKICKSKHKILTSLMFGLIVLPYNITFQLPENIDVLGKKITLNDSYTNGMSVNYLIPTLSILDVFIFITLFSFIYSLGIKKIAKRLSNYKYSLILILLFFIIQNIFIKEFLSVFNSIRIYAVIVSFLLIVDYLKNLHSVNSKKLLIKNAIIINLINTLIQGIVSILQFLMGESIGLYFLGESKLLAGKVYSSFITFNNSVYLRAYGTFPHPNVLAGFFLFTILFTFFLYRISNKEALRSICRATLLLCNFFVIITFSRLGILLSILSTTVLLTSYYWKNKKLKINFNNNKHIESRKNNRDDKNYSFAGLFLSRFTKLFSGNDNSITERIQLIKVSFSIIKRNYLVGTGIGNFVRNIGEEVPYSAKGVKILQPVHNIFLLCLSDLGIIGMMIFVYSFIDFCRKNIGIITLFKMAILTDILLIGFFDHYLIDLPQGIFILCGLLCLCVLNKRREWDSNP